MKKFIFYFVTLIIIIFLEIALSKFSLFGIFFVIFIGMHRGSSAGATFGFFTGLIEGVFSATSFGVCSFSYSLTGYLAGRLPERIDEGNPLVQIIIIFSGVILAKAVNIIMEMIFTGTRSSFYNVLTIVFVLFAPLFFKVFKFWWHLWFKKLEVER